MALAERGAGGGPERPHSEGRGAVRRSVP